MRYLVIYECGHLMTLRPGYAKGGFLDYLGNCTACNQIDDGLALKADRELAQRWDREREGG